MSAEREAGGAVLPRRRATGAAVVLAVVALGAGCGGGDGDGGDSAIDDAPAPAQTTVPAAVTGPDCTSGRPAVVLDLGLTAVDLDTLMRWFGGDQRPEPRTGAPELLQAYRERNYEVIYLSALPSDSQLEGRPASDVLTEWLDEHGFPTGEGSHLVMWDTAVTNQVSVYKTQVLIDLATNGTAAYYGYSDDDFDVQAMRNAGIPAERIFTVGEVAGTEGTVAATGGDTDWTQHRTEVVDPMPPACTG